MMNKIKVYAADVSFLKNKKLFTKLYAEASSERQRKIDSKAFEKDKILSLAAELILKKALSAEGINEFRIHCGDNGKPYAVGEKIRFNLSHSGTRVMCAVSESDVGCDVETVTNINLKIAQRYFCEEEYLTIMSAASEEEKLERFFRLWTLKESFIKATGYGMKIPLTSFKIGLCEDKATICQSLNQNQYFFKEYNLNDGYKYAVCGLTDRFDRLQFVSLDPLCFLSF